MRIGVISDTHIPERTDKVPAVVLEAFRSVDMIIHAGDLVSAQVLDLLAAVCPQVRAVYGNMDSYELRKKLPEKDIISVGNFKIGLMHGYGAPSGLIGLMEKTFKNSNCDLIIFGHSHTPISEIKGNTIFFNPGSPTDKIFSPYNSYGIIEVKDKIEAKIIKIQ